MIILKYIFIKGESIMKKFLALVVSAGAMMIAGVAQAATLDDVKARGYLQCGVSQGLPGFQMLMITVTGQELMLICAVV